MPPDDVTPPPTYAAAAPVRDGRITHTIDDYDLDAFVEVCAAYGTERFGYVVTPNVDHMIRYHEDSAFRALYADAAYVLLDSRFAAYLLRLVRGLKLPVCTGSDLTAALLQRVIRPQDRVVLIGSSTAQADAVRRRFGLLNLRHHNPPMGFVKDPQAVEETLRFVEDASPFRFCFIAVGSPQQEVVAQHLRRRGVARGLALCIGASIDFVTGAERRAPTWMQRAGLEWIYRLSQNPRRLARRYLVRGPQFFANLRHADIKLRPR
ncbi:MAG TPA: WecB/TagA/CpsF family glycosyltransferase [Burkholderiaceae bacterium]|nr:WecB/TagA/CpsF family glycosyltransferase [Burkholderiaceae bacterium]